MKENWHVYFHVNPFVLFNYKLKKLKKALTTWSRATYGDIFQKIASLEDVVLVHEAQFEAFPTQDNRERLQRVQADMIKYLAIEKEFWKQKAEMQWLRRGIETQNSFMHMSMAEGKGFSSNVSKTMLEIELRKMVRLWRRQ